jgi:hypothetical protein
MKPLPEPRVGGIASVVALTGRCSCGKASERVVGIKRVGLVTIKLNELAVRTTLARRADHPNNVPR